MASRLGSKTDRRLVLKYHSLWTKTEMQVLAFFAKNKNRPSTYIEIARAYISSSYSHFRKACEALRSRGWLNRLQDGSYEVHPSSLSTIQKGREFIEFRLPYFDKFKKSVRKIY